VALGFAGAVWAAVGGSPSVGGTECAHNPLALEGMAELVSVIFPIRGDGVGGRRSGGRLGLEELFDAVVLSRSEVGEFGVVGGELSEHFLFVGCGHHDVVEVAVELLEHGILVSE